MRRRGDIWLLVTMFVLLVVGAFLIASPGQAPISKAPTSFNADPDGNRAFYTLMERLGYRVQRLDRPYDQLPSDAKLLIVVVPDGVRPDVDSQFWKAPDEKEIMALVDWVERGGNVLAFGGDGSDVAADAIYGKRVHHFLPGSVISNKAMHNPSNALGILKEIDSRVSKGDMIVFDEYHHGIVANGSRQPGMARQVKVALWILAAALLVFCYSVGRRFGAVRSLPEADAARPGFEFVESLGRLYRRAKATDLAAEVICDSFRRDLCAKLGLSTASSRRTIIERLGEPAGSDVFKRVDAVLGACEAGHKPSPHELLHIAREIRSLEKELRIGSVDG